MFPGGKGGRCVGLTTLPPSCADYLEIWEPQPPGTLRACQACNGIALPLPISLTNFAGTLYCAKHFILFLHTESKACVKSTNILCRSVLCS